MTSNPGFFWSVGAFLLLIGPLIFVHEMGHYLVGRWCGVKADCFSIGFGRELIGWTDARGTRWKVSALPLGGYVKFAGDMGPASEPSPEWLALPARERNRTFQAKKLWQKFLIVLAGPVTNFAFAILVYMAVFATYGVPQTPAVVHSVMPGTAAAHAGIEPGDRITMIARRGIADARDVTGLVQMRPGETVRMDVYRGKRQIHLNVTFGSQLMRDRFGNESRLGLLGVLFVQNNTIVHLRTAQLPGAALNQVVQTVDGIASTLGQIITGARPVTELHGPVGMAGLAGEVASLGWLDFIWLMAAISINLGFINLLPIPMLDGGHLMFYLIEGVKRRPVERRMQEWAYRSGLALLATFMLFVTVHDVASLSVWQGIAGLIARG